MAAVSSGVFDTRAGTGSVTIDPDNSTSLPNTTMKVADIGVLEADYDLKDDSEQSNNVLFNLGEFRFDVFERLGNGDSLFEELDNIASTTNIEVELDFTDNSSRNWTERFEFTANDIEYSYRDRKITIESSFNFQFNGQISQVVGGNCSEVFLVDGYNEGNTSAAPVCGLTANDTSEIHAITAKGFIEYILGEMNASNTVINNSSVANGEVAPGDHEFFVLSSDATTTSHTADDPAQPLFYRLAVADGAIIGSYLGYNFFVKRLDTSDSVSISTDQVRDLNIMTTLEDYFGVRHVFTSILDSSLTNSSSHGTMWFDALLGSVSGDELNDDATKYTNIYFNTSSVALANDVGTNDWQDDSRSLFNNLGITTTEDATEGDKILRTSGSPNVTLSEGDHVFPNASYDRAYIVDSVTSDSITLKEPLRADIDSGASLLSFDDMSISEDSLTNSVEAYAKAYAAQSTRRIELTIFGIDTLKPYEVIQLGTGFNTLLSGHTFRPSKMTYDLNTDTITVEAYQIA